MKKREKTTTVRSAVIANIVGLLLLGMLYASLSSHAGYGFVFRSLRVNYKTISENRHVPLSQRYVMKLNSSYLVYAQLAASTPPDAVIYLPGKKAFAIESNGVKLQGSTYTKGWALRFLYPRKVVLESEYDTSIYTPQITHVAIVNGVGAEKLPYKLSSVPAFGVLPIDPSQLTPSPSN